MVAMPGQSNAQTVQRLLLTAMINQRVALVEQGVRIHVAALADRGGGAGVDGLVRAMAEISGRGIVVQDKRLSILAQQPSAELKHRWGKMPGFSFQPGKPARIPARPQAGGPAYGHGGSKVEW